MYRSGQYNVPKWCVPMWYSAYTYRSSICTEVSKFRICRKSCTEVVCTEMVMYRSGPNPITIPERHRQTDGQLASAIHRESKNMPPNFCLYYLHQILTDFKNYFTGTLCGKCAIILLLNIPPHLYCVATLPCEI